MLVLQNADGGMPLKCDDYAICEMASGYDELIFEISIWDKAYPDIHEEAEIIERSSEGAGRYIVKAIDGGGETAEIIAQLDVSDWKSTLMVGYKSASSRVGSIVASVAPQGWSVSDKSGITYRRTISLAAATPLDVLDACRETFSGVTFRFDTVAKEVTIVNANAGTNLGAYVTRDLNLRENNYIGKSTDLITRLYAYGKDGLSFADINDGKEFVDNFTYSNKVICGYWQDERYTNKESLLADAQARLDELAVPQRSYECDVVDLAAVSKEKYGFLDFSLFSKVSLIDKTRGKKRIEHKVVERWRYPFFPQKNRIILSTVAPRIQTQIQRVMDSIYSPNSDWSQQQASARQTAIDDAVANATGLITGAKGGHMRAIYNAEGKWEELVCMNSEDIATATNVWRFNLGGLGYSSHGYGGPFETAITMDGSIVADFIKVGTLDAALVRVKNIDATNINTGTLLADLIKAGTIKSQNDAFSIGMNEGVLTATSSDTYSAANYSQTDIDRLRSILLDEITPTAADFEKFDFYKKGELTLTDLTICRAIVNSGEDLTIKWTTQINPNDRSRMVVAWMDKTGAQTESNVELFKLGLAGIAAKTAAIDEATIGSVSATTLLSNGYDVDWVNRGTAISAGSDILRLSPGRYYCVNTATATSLVNCPATINFALFVYDRNLSGGQRKNFVLHDQSGNVFTNTQTGETSYSGWRKLSYTTV